MLSCWLLATWRRAVSLALAALELGLDGVEPGCLLVESGENELLGPCRRLVDCISNW